jgi:outer membrane protein assembly factor BamB
MSNSKRNIYIMTTLLILSLSTLAPAISFAAPTDQSAENWENMNGGGWAWNYSPQTQINSDNVDDLEVQWLYSIPGAAASMPDGMETLNARDGSSTPPLVIDGTVIIATNYLRTIALDATTGEEIWAHSYDVAVDEILEKLPLFSASFGGVHNHGFRYWAAEDSVINRGVACDFYGVGAKTGETTFWVKDLCENVPGNVYKYHMVYHGVKSGSIGIYEKGNQFIYVLSGGMHSTTYEGDGRHVTMGVSTSEPYNILWRVFSYPPQDKPTKDWALEECDNGFFMDIPCSEVASSNRENLEWDWSQPNEPPNIFGGVTANWGQIVVDEDTGIIYTQTGNQGPYTYIGATPGPRLYGSTIMAIDGNTGQRIWWVQPFPRDPYDYDCNWSGVLVDDPELGKVYIKGCKEGRLYVIDAETGEPIYIKDVTDEQYQWGQIGIEGTLEPNEGGIKYHLNDPFSFYDMREMESPDGSNYCGRPCPVYPGWLNGIFQVDTSYDPQTGTLYHYAAALQTTILNSPPAEPGARVSQTRGSANQNVSIVARDVSSGDVKWTWFWPVGAQRSHLVVTSDIIFAGFTDGKMRFFNNNGDLIREMTIGSHMLNGFTTGQDSNGDQKIFGVVGVGRIGASVYPSPTAAGTVVALGLRDAPTTVTSTQRTTLTTTSSVTLTSTTATTSTLTSTLPASTTTTTVTSEVTEETGLPAEITYAAVAVAVIAIIAAAVLTMRKR